MESDKNGYNYLSLSVLIFLEISL